MVLDEDALESMLRRQNGESESEGRPAAELTDETEEFEVYERPRSEADEEPEEPPAPSPGPDLVQDEDPFEELPGRHADPEERPADAPSLPQETVDPQPPASEEAPRPTSEDTPRRPRVWPPVGEGRSHNPETAPPTPQEPPAQPTPQPEATAPTAASGSGCRLAIVQATFNAEITDMMADIARQRADKTGCTVTQTAQVAGVYDLPLTAQAMARRDDVDAVVVLGAVVQGETQHDLVITQSTAATLQRVSLETGKPIGFGVTGPGMTWKQAEARVVNAKHAVDAAVTQWQALKTA